MSKIIWSFVASSQPSRHSRGPFLLLFFRGHTLSSFFWLLFVYMCMISTRKGSLGGRGIQERCNSSRVKQIRPARVSRIFFPLPSRAQPRIHDLHPRASIPILHTINRRSNRNLSLFRNCRRHLTQYLESGGPAGPCLPTYLSGFQYRFAKSIQPLPTPSIPQDFLSPVFPTPIPSHHSTDLSAVVIKLPSSCLSSRYTPPLSHSVPKQPSSRLPRATLVILV